ncbi:MAG TPA: dTDP-4-dehydrorhamnose reductase [Gammaproteobacteria bacterium]|nr:dTDP-4-dehydrorhamnose reductase [Gammaproteobacteria bacterium]
MRILVFGRVGQLGSALAELLPGHHEVTFLDQPEVDLSQSENVSNLIAEYAPALVINAAAYTAVDKAETEPQLAHSVNADAPAAMARSCQIRGVPLIHYSTDYVFDGSASVPYTEDAVVAPASVYGRTKLAGEQAVARETDHHIIFRTAWLYSHIGHNFLKTMLRVASEGKPLRVVDDQIGSPTFAWDLGIASVAAVDALEEGREDVYGIFHATNSGLTSWYGFAQKIFEVAGIDTVDLSPIPTESYPTPAPRPAYSVLDCDRLYRVLKVEMPDWQDALARCIARL